MSNSVTSGVSATAATAVPTQALVVNEVLGSTASADVEYVEILGAAGASLEGLSLIIVESDATSTNGQIDKRYDFTADDALGENGFFLVGNGLVAGAYGVTPDAALPADFIENSSYTVALVETASLGGVSGSETVVDAVGVTDGEDLGSFLFEAPVVGPDGTFLPAGVGRVEDGVDTDQASDFALLDFNNDPAVNTPTAGAGGPGDYRKVMIHEVQGSTDLADGIAVGVEGAADESPLNGEAVRIQGIVTQIVPGLGGFFVQEEDADADADASTSEGVFVASLAVVAVGDFVTIEGTVLEAAGETRIASASVAIDASGLALPDAVAISFPTGTVLQDADGDYVANLEAYEGMRVTVPEEMTVSELFQLDRFGTIRLTSEGRSETFTQNNAPSVEGFDTHLREVASRSLVIDDGSSLQSPAELKVPFLGEDGVLTAGDEFRMGDAYTGLAGVVGFSEDPTGSEEPEYRIHLPTEGEVVQNNPREDAPDVGGTLTVASFNVLNYFTTIEGGTGPDGLQEPRGASSAEEFARQEAKIVAAIQAISSDVIGLTEIENDPEGSVSLAALTAALNEAGGSYAYVDAGPIEGVQGGELEGDAIKVAFLYDTSTMTLNGDFALLDQSVDPRFQSEGVQRPSLAQTFTETDSGESFTAVINHLKSKGSAVGDDVDQEDGQGPSAATRTAAAEALADWLAGDPTGTEEEDVLILGDLNAYRREDPITAIREGSDDAPGTADDYVDLGETFDPEGISYVFDGKTGTLDYALAGGTLASQVTGAAYWNINADEADVLDYNLDFGRDPALFAADPFRASDHDPIVVGLDLEAGDNEPDVFTLELLHLSDQEGNGSSVLYAPNVSAVMNALEAQDLGGDGASDNTIRLSSGDAIIPGAFYDASAAVFGSGGIGDIQIQNELGLQAIAFGNHEFDKGPQAIADLISGAAPGGFDALDGTALDGQDFGGTLMPYLSTNLDFSTEASLAPLEVEGGQTPVGNAVTSSTVLEENGELIGVAGATTPTLARISTTGTLEIVPPWAGTTPTGAELDALAAVIQGEVDALLDANPSMNKVILATHMQQIEIEQALAGRLRGVDVIVAGGSNTRLLDADDVLIPGDSVQGEYPQFVTSADGGVTVVVNTDGNYKYVGRLVVDFDEDGRVIADSYNPAVSGAYSADDAGVARLGAEDLVDPEVQAIADAIGAQIIATEGNVFGLSDVFLNGSRSGLDTGTDPDGVRTQETNLGDLTSDANLAYAREADDTVLVSIKNGGGIRASVGETVVPAGGTGFVRQPNGEITDAEGNVVKPEGGISQADIAAALAFNNALTLVTVTRAELVAIIEHGISALPGVAGQFPQISGLQISFDATQPAGSRLVSATITDGEGNDLDVLVRNGEVVGDADAGVRVVTLGFLADGGDGYPFPEGGGADRVDLADLDGNGAADGTRDGVATFADTGTEQDAFAEYLAANHATEETAYDVEDVGRAEDERIQDLAFREDTVIDALEFEFIGGTAGRERLVGTAGADVIAPGAGRFDTMRGDAGADVFLFGLEALDGVRERDTILDYEVGVDAIGLGAGVTVASVRDAGSTVVVRLDDPEGADDAIYVRGERVTADAITFVDDPLSVAA